MDRYCQYYQATLEKQHALYVVGTLKYYDHICFDRTLDRDTLLYEFFVPADCEQEFLTIMDSFIKKGFVGQLEKKANRIQTGQEF